MLPKLQRHTNNPDSVSPRRDHADQPTFQVQSPLSAPTPTPAKRRGRQPSYSLGKGYAPFAYQTTAETTKAFAIATQFIKNRLLEDASMSSELVGAIPILTTRARIGTIWISQRMATA